MPCFARLYRLNHMSVFSQSKPYKIVAGDAAQGKLSHAYLLVCPDARNLRSFLKELAVLVLGADERAGGLIEREMYADCVVLPAPGAKFTVADAKNVSDECYIKPVEGDKKLFVLDGVQDMNASAQNKLLKVLEEPPANVCFLLGSVNDFAVLPTIKSRAKRLDLFTFADAEIEKYIRAAYPHRKDAAEIAAVSGGILGRAQELAEGGDLGAAAEEAALFAMNLSVSSAIGAARKYADKEKIGGFLSVLKLVYRDILMLKLGRRDLLLSGGQEKLLERAAARYSAAALVGAQEKISAAERDIKFNANLASCLETLFIGILEGR